MVKRYFVAGTSGTPAGWHDYVLAADYDALAAELAGYKESHDKYCPSAARIAQNAARIEGLEAALEWAIQGNRIVDYGSGIEGRSSGCGCCSYDEEIPEELRMELILAYRRLHPETGPKP